MSSLQYDSDKQNATVRVASPSRESGVIKNDSLEYVAEQGGNGSLPTYQEASGAPIESSSPLGYDVSWYSIIFLNIGQMIGTGVFSTPSSILAGTGSVGLSLMYWVIGFIIACCALGVYLELASYFPARSGAEVVYLEQAYPRPRYFFPIAYALQMVILSFASSNAVVLAQYVFKIAGREGTDWELKGVAIAGYTLAVLFMVANNKVAIRISDFLGFIKVLTLIFITGLVCLGGHTAVADPTINFRDAFAGTTGNGNGLANSLVKITFSYAGYQNAFRVMNEVKDPIKTIKKSAPLSLLVVATLYVLCNIAYFAAVPKEDILNSEQVAASLFFTAIFGSRAAKGLNILIVLSAFGNLISVLIGHSRVVREIGRQGVLPWPSFWASTRPFGTPLGPYFITWAVTILMILAPPAGDAFNFIVDLQTYPNAVFVFLMTLGIYLIRRQRARIGISKHASEFRCWDAAIIFNLLVNAFLLVMPWYPPEGGATGGDVSFWYATYCVVGIGFLLICAVYYGVWIYVLPKWGGYEMRQRVLVLPDGAITHQLVKVPKAEVAKWDEEHDALGNRKCGDMVEPEKV